MSGLGFGGNASELDVLVVSVYSVVRSGNPRRRFGGARVDDRNEGVRSHQLPPELLRRIATIEARLDGTLKARIGGQFVELTACEKIEKTQAIESVRPARRHVPPPAQSQWMNNFSVARQK